MGRKLRQLHRFFKRGRRRRPSRTALTARKAGRFRLPRKYIALALIILVVAGSAHSFYRFDRAILPLVLDAAEMRFQAEINHIINAVVQDVIQENGITAEDFILQTQFLTDQQPVLSINTVLANEINNEAAQRISEKLNNLEPETVYVPIGMALGLDILAQVGPRFSFDLAPIGNALVNYETSFTAVGINQTHFAVWLNVECVVRIINPVHSSEIVVARNISLVDTIISGVVPGTYLNMETPGFILN